VAALDMCREAGNRRVEVQLQVRQCEVLLYEGRCAEAENSLTDLLATVRESGDVVGQSKILRLLGRVNAQLGRPGAAERLFTEASTALEVEPGPGRR